jgi:hypothetical protein
MSQPSREQLYAEFYEFVTNLLTLELGRTPTIAEIEDAIDNGDWEPHGDGEIEVEE